jgi:Ca-activated chloride channel family protein
MVPGASSTNSNGSIPPSAISPPDYGIMPPGGYNSAAEYLASAENGFISPADSPLSTFSLDVNTASYSLVRRQLRDGYMPVADSVKIEEMINYFTYDLKRPAKGTPFSISTEVHTCPWNNGNYLSMIALQGYDIGKEDLPPSNLVFLVDISGSMYLTDRLPLAQRAMCLLVDQLRDQDTVTIVVYASSTGVVLEATPGSEKDKIKGAIYGLRAEGSTYGAGGIELAYEAAAKSYVEGGNNRVILCTDGDFNVGISSVSDLEELIVEKRESGVYLSVLGFGMSNLKDDKMETLATKGNGNYAYIDNIREAHKVLADDMTSTIFTIAKDVKLQAEFNPETVSAYRLIGYEKRLLNDEDFADDIKDAGEMGAGHSMIAFYEIIPATAIGVSEAPLEWTPQTGSDAELLRISLRYKHPDSDTSISMDTISISTPSTAPPSETFNFASAVAEWGLLLANSEFKAAASIEGVLKRAFYSRGADTFGYRSEFVQLVDLYRLMSASRP